MVYVIQVCWQLASRIRTELVPSWSCSQAVSKFLLDPARKLSASSVLILLASCQQVPSWSCSQAVSKIVWHIPLLCVQWKTPDDGQKNCPKHVEFYSKNKFEKLVDLFPLGRPRLRWVDNIRMDLQEVGCGYMDWTGLAQDRDRWRTLVSAVMNLRVPW